MIEGMYGLGELSVKPAALFLHIPPLVWKGDILGHVGKNDLFFFVLEGECFLRIDSQSYIVRPGQIAYLPKGKVRAYTHASERFSMYEMAFVAHVQGQELMELLGLTDGDYVVSVEDVEQMSSLFECATRHELIRDPINDIAWCANIINIIRIYAEQRRKHSSGQSHIFKGVLEYMAQNISREIRIEELSSLVYMQPTYFVRRFGACFGLSPIAYLNRMKMYKAMGMLAQTDMSIENIAREIGIGDTSYFSRIFKKHASVTPSEYRAAFRRS